MRYLAERPNRANGALLDFPRSVDDLFQRFWNPTPLLRADTWQPAADVLETPQAYVLHLDIPGIDPDMVEVTLTGDVLTVRADRKLADKADGESWHLNERMQGSFERVFSLPSVGSAKDIQAEARHGVLTIRVPKAKEAQPLRVTIKKG